MTASEIATALHARNHGRYWMARCPVHEDRCASVSIRQWKGGVAIKCFAGCDRLEILRALGLKLSDLGYSSDSEWKNRIVRAPKSRSAGGRKPLGKLEDTYAYTDEDGQLVAEKLRFEGKVFLWRRPGPGGRWIWTVNAQTLPLYALHKLKDARIAILTEGEKDVRSLQRVVKQGVAVTTAPNGAKSWKKEYAAHFSAKTVWIVPDSDVPGGEYARMAARDIARAGGRVRIVSVAPYKDVSEYLIEHTVQDLASIARKPKAAWVGREA